MKHIRIAILVAACALSASSLAQIWGTNYAKAVAESKKTGKPILVNFTGSDWCGYCIQLRDDVFSKPEFKTWAKKNVVLLELDYPAKKRQSAALKKQNETLADKYRVQSYPTILMIDAKGKVLGTGGYMEGGPKAWTSHFSSFIPKKRTK